MKTSTGLLIILAIALLTAASIPSPMRLAQCDGSQALIDAGAWSITSWELPGWALHGPDPGGPFLSQVWMLAGGMWSTR